MFVLADKYLFWHPVQVVIPDPKKAGKTIKQDFEVQFEAMPYEDAKAFDEEAVANQDPTMTVADRQIDLIKIVVKDWKSVVDADGDEIQFSHETLSQALRFSWIRSAIWNAYTRAMSGEARTGN